MALDIRRVDTGCGSWKEQRTTEAVSKAAAAKPLLNTDHSTFSGNQLRALTEQGVCRPRPSGNVCCNPQRLIAIGQMTGRASCMEV